MFVIALTLLLAQQTTQQPAQPTLDWTGTYESNIDDGIDAEYVVVVTKVEAGGYEARWYHEESGQLTWIGELREVDGQWVEHYPERSPFRCPDYGWLTADGRPAQVARDGASWWMRKGP